MSKEYPLIMKDFDVPNILDIDVAIEQGYYDAVTKAVTEMSPDDVVDLVKDSTLQGRGGAWFSAGMKWSFMPKEPKEDSYICVNCDESEPGTFKDRALIEKNPHLALAGIIIGAYAIRARVAYVYIRGEMTLGIELMTKAIEEAREKGFIGKNICGTDAEVQVYVHPGAGAYICGEETGLMESLEGKRAYPRNKPPFPAQSGAFGRPTTVNNLGTLCYVPYIVKNGADWFKGIGYEPFPGTLIYSVCGHVNKPGLYECTMDITLRELIELAGGVRDGHELKAVIPGGSSMPVLTPDEIDVRMAPDSFKPRGDIVSGLGSAGIIVMDETVHMPDALLNMMKFYAHESCGQCTPCREGCKWVHDVLERLNKGNGSPDDVEMLEEILRNVGDIDKFEFNKTICLFGVSFGWPATIMLRKFKGEFEALLPEKTLEMPMLA